MYMKVQRSVFCSMVLIFEFLLILMGCGGGGCPTLSRTGTSSSGGSGELVPVRLKVGQPPPPHPIRISKNSKISTIEQKTLRCTFMYILHRCHSLLTRQNAGPQQAANNCRSACAG